MEPSLTEGLAFFEYLAHIIRVSKGKEKVSRGLPDDWRLKAAINTASSFKVSFGLET